MIFTAVNYILVELLQRDVYIQERPLVYIANLLAICRDVSLCIALIRGH